MRNVARTLAAVLFATVAACGIANPDQDDTVEAGTGDDGTNTPGAGAGESFDTPHIEPKEDKGSGDGSGGDGSGGGGEGSGGEGSGSGGEGSGGEGSGGEDSCDETENTCGELPPPPPPVTCDHDQDGDCDNGDCDHDDDGDCDGDDGGDGHIEGACTFTQGFWKNHPDAWPVASLLLGAHTYSSAQLIDILRTPVANDGLMILVHQLIAAKLNVAFGAPDASISAAIIAADALIGNLVVGVDTLPSSSTSGLATVLDTFNNSKLADEECN